MGHLATEEVPLGALQAPKGESKVKEEVSCEGTSLLHREVRLLPWG